MTFAQDESSVETSKPREGVELILPAQTLRYATGTRDVNIGGPTFRARPVSRGEIQVAQVEKTGDVELVMPATDPFVVQYMAGPPRLVLVNIWRLQAGGESQCTWRGHITGIQFDGQLARFQVPSRSVGLMQRRLPTVAVGRACPHVLYDAQCRVDRTYWRVDTTVSDVNGRTVKVAAMTGGAAANNWSKFGELVLVSTGERMTIVEQIGTTLTLQLPISGLSVGNSVQVFAGCDHTIGTCRSKFTNVLNFGGQPELPLKNPYFRNGYGMYTSEG